MVSRLLFWLFFLLDLINSLLNLVYLLLEHRGLILEKIELHARAAYQNETGRAKTDSPRVADRRPHPEQTSGLTLAFPKLREMAPVGHTLAQRPHPTHTSSLISTIKGST